MAFEGSCYCGKVAFAVEADPPARAIHLRCVETIDLDALDLQQVDGASL